MILELSEHTGSEIYHLMTQTVIPRPIAWVLTDSGQKNYNLAPFSYFSAVSSAPPLLMVSIGHKPNGEQKDTYRNLIEKKQCVIHIAADNEYQTVTRTAASLNHGESEIEKNNLTTVEFEGFDLPRLDNCPIAFGCTFFEEKQIGEAPQHLVFVKIEKIYIADSVTSLDKNDRIKVHADKIKPLARLGAAEYAQFGEIISQQRPK